MSSLKIYDNFLSTKDHLDIYSTMISHSFPWHLNKILEDDHVGLNINTLDNLEFTHLFYYDNFNYSSYINILFPILNKIQPKSLIRIRAALIPRRDFIEADAYHVDLEDYNCKTAIYYVNTNDGYTKFDTGEKISSVENRFIEFDSNKMHTGSFTTDSKYRILINFNYF